MQGEIEIDESYFLLRFHLQPQANYAKHRLAEFKGIKKENFMILSQRIFNLYIIPKLKSEICIKYWHKNDKK